MRKSALLAVVLLPLVLVTSGCCCLRPCGGSGAAPGTDPSQDRIGGPTINPGVVEVYRHIAGQKVLVGYVVKGGELDDGVSWWLLNYNETPPVMPTTSTTPNNVVTWERNNDTAITIADLCKKPGLSTPTLWRLQNSTVNCPK